ncbi:MAG: malonic semialdehyde reductase [Caedimonas sp.]|nr:malonic semialdehyde reductase [Caedimonas sp.]
MSVIKLSDQALDQLFRLAHTHYAWLPDREVSNETLQELYQLVRMGPTSANGQPMRLLFIKSLAAKERLKPYLAPANVAKTMSAPVIVVVAHDLEFYEKLPALNLAVDARPWFAGNPNLIQETAFRNSSLQGAYLILAARALGLDCGPMSGFDAGGVDQEFFADVSWRSNFLINLGYGDTSKAHPRQPRLTFGEACKIL